MVSAGLYFTQYTDLVCCPFCNIVMAGWRPGDDPFERHTRLRPSCPFINPCGAEYTDL
jgi:baculoviral IAP repeat-containing protein 2/3